MSLTAFCDNCGKKIRVGAEYAGKKVKCLHCGHMLILPKREDFLSDPHAEFAMRGETKKEEEEPEPQAPAGKPPFEVPSAAERAEAPPAPSPAPMAPQPEPAQVAPLPRTTYEPEQAGDLVRGLAFGFGFWLSGLPFLLLGAVLVLALVKGCS